MNSNMKIFLSILAVIIIGGGSLALGALTAPKRSPVAAPHTSTPAKIDLTKQLESELPTITNVMTAAYPKIATDYIVSKGRLYDKGQWYGAVLTYRGTDAMNRDTLRVLLEKKNGAWEMHTTPPEPLLSAKKYKNIPVSILKSINQPVSLPGTDNSPTINPNE